MNASPDSQWTHSHRDGARTGPMTSAKEKLERGWKFFMLKIRKISEKNQTHIFNNPYTLAKSTGVVHMGRDSFTRLIEVGRDLIIIFVTFSLASQVVQKFQIFYLFWNFFQIFCLLQYFLSFTRERWYGKVYVNSLSEWLWHVSPKKRSYAFVELDSSWNGFRDSRHTFVYIDSERGKSYVTFETKI